MTKPQRGPAGPRGKHPLTQEGSGDKDRFRETRPTEAREEMQIGEDVSGCVFGWERLQQDTAAGHSSKFPRGRGVRSSAGGRGWAGRLAASQGRGAGLRDPPHPFRPQWEARSPSCTPGRSPPPLRRCLPSPLPTGPLHLPSRGPTCEEHLILEQAPHHPQQLVLHVLAASLLTLLLPRDQNNKTPSGTPAPGSGLTAFHVSPATHVPAGPSPGRAELSPKPGSPPPGSPLRLALSHSGSSFLQAHTLLHSAIISPSPRER